MAPTKDGINIFGDYYNVIDGKVCPTTDTRHGVNPSTGDKLPEVPLATEADVDVAVAAARKAFNTWSILPWAERRDAIIGYIDAIERHAEDFAKLLTLEQGKPLMFARMELKLALDFARVTTNLELEEEVLQQDDERRTVIRYIPLGVAVGIVPWNFPVHMALMKIIPSLVTGNPIIIKSSPFTPYCGLKLVELGQGFFPPGVLQALSGDDNLGPWLTGHPGPDKISFTGSCDTGRKVMESASRTLKRVTLELGGNDPAIICPDIDIATVAQKITQLAFLNSGQVCLAVKRIYVHKSIYEPFLTAMVNHAKNLTMGDGMKEGVLLGPIQNATQLDKIKTFFNDIKRDSLTVALGGEIPNNGGAGYFVPATIIDRPPEDSRIVALEPFGPIIPIMQWEDEADVIVRANDSSYALGASVWSSNPDTANRIARLVQAGSVWVNAHLEVNPLAPTGGHKESGIGYELGYVGLKSYCNTQVLYLSSKAN
ncbi:Aldehyde/histidinol dehydrogenase [Aspergillus granulosus]|uniref:aldehyde dehydrogenase (NAD(+)) n=1 Tax=Aspergillus granulosus TaxID=176169 RepID=A0ABR4GVH6_9EURO